MDVKITNVCDRMIGGPGGEPIAPGESLEFDLTAEQLKAWEAFEHAEVQRLDRSKGSRDKATTAKADDPGSSE